MAGFYCNSFKEKNAWAGKTGELRIPCSKDYVSKQSWPVCHAEIIFRTVAQATRREELRISRGEHHLAVSIAYETVEQV